ncbi:hypothetical protein AB0945_28245 [Streptomyces sp. NPDC005474]|uniref:hypothetical protein n=1 Tax=Streptomyces sp. NPDC005474 TaxID=3154878 RepID=UPI0034519AAC
MGATKRRRSATCGRRLVADSHTLGGLMFSLLRTRRFAFAAAGAVGVAVLGGVALAVTPVYGHGDPDPQADSEVAVCSDVPVHAWVTVNVATGTRPDNRKVDYEVESTGHDHDPFGLTVARGCEMAGGAFGSRVEFKAPGLNEGQPFSVTAPADRKHVLVVRFTKNTDDTVTGTQKLVLAHG